MGTRAPNEKTAPEGGLICVVGADFYQHPFVGAGENPGLHFICDA